jgi:hypothetical protein
VNDIVRKRSWQRLLLVELAQMPFAALAIFGDGMAALWIAGIAGSFICCAGTDSLWRWRNRLLVVQAIGWLCVPLLVNNG